MDDGWWMMDNNSCVICLVYLPVVSMNSRSHSFEYWLMLMLIQSSFTFTDQYCLKLLAWPHWTTAFNCNQAERWCLEIDFFSVRLVILFFLLHKYVLTQVEFSSASITQGEQKVNKFLHKHCVRKQILPSDLFNLSFFYCPLTQTPPMW